MSFSLCERLFFAGGGSCERCAEDEKRADGAMEYLSIVTLWSVDVFLGGVFALLPSGSAGSEKGRGLEFRYLGT